MTGARATVGTETQAYELETGTSGVTRVLREVHAGLDVTLSAAGIELVPVHTRPSPERADAPPDPYLAGDPVLARAVRTVDEVDALLILGFNAATDFAHIRRRRIEASLPTISLVHDVIPLGRPEWFVPRARESFRAYLQQLLHVSDHVIVTSETVRDGLLGLGWRIPGEVHVMPLGSSFPQQPASSAAGPPLRLVYVSTVAPRKGHVLLVEAFDALRSRGVDVHLTIIGREGWMADDIVESIVGHPEYGTSLIWLRSASDREIVETAQRCHIAVVPAEDEGYGMFLEEGLTLGLKTVVRDIPVFRERNYPNLFFAEGTPDAFADVILAAHGTAQHSLAAGTVRAMSDFSRELAELVQSVVR